MLQFVPDKKGLHVLYCKSYFSPGKDGCVFWQKIGLPIIKALIKGVSLVKNRVEAITTVEGKKRNLTERDIKQAKVARHFQHRARHLSDHTLVCTASTNEIKNLPIVIQYVKLMNDSP